MNQVTVLSGSAGQNKTSRAITHLIDALADGKTVLFINVEDDMESILDRINDLFEERELDESLKDNGMFSDCEFGIRAIQDNVYDFYSNGYKVDLIVIDGNIHDNEYYDLLSKNRNVDVVYTALTVDDVYVKHAAPVKMIDILSEKQEDQHESI